MPEIDEVVLKDYVATANNPEYNGDWSVINSKFPELEGVDEQLLKDYVATANNSKYNMNWEVINSKFPEFKEERLEPGQGILTPEAFEQGKEIPAAETTAPAADVTTDFMESVSGSGDSDYLELIRKHTQNSEEVVSKYDAINVSSDDEIEVKLIQDLLKKPTKENRERIISKAEADVAEVLFKDEDLINIPEDKRSNFKGKSNPQVEGIGIHDHMFAGKEMGEDVDLNNFDEIFTSTTIPYKQKFNQIKDYLQEAYPDYNFKTSFISASSQPSIEGKPYSTVTMISPNGDEQLVAALYNDDTKNFTPTDIKTKIVDFIDTHGIDNSAYQQLELKKDEGIAQVDAATAITPEQQEKYLNKFDAPDLFDEYMEKSKISGFDFPIQPYKKELEDTKSLLQKIRDEENKLLSSADQLPEVTEQEIQDYTRQRLIAQEKAKLKSDNLTDYLEENEDEKQAIFKYYAKVSKDKKFTQAVAAQTVFDDLVNKKDNFSDLQKQIRHTEESFSDPTYLYVETDDVVTLENGKIIPKEVYTNYTNNVQKLIDYDQQINDAYKEVETATNELNDVDLQLELLGKDYGTWRKFKANIGTGFSSIGMGLAYGLGKASQGMKHLEESVRGVEHTESDMIGAGLDMIGAEFTDWKQETMSNYANDVRFDDAFSSVDKFGRFFVQEVGQQIPILTTIITTGGTASPFVIGAYTMGEKYMDMDLEDVRSGKERSEWEKFGVSLGYGASEAILGTLPTTKILGRGRNYIDQAMKRGVLKPKDYIKMGFKEQLPRVMVYEPLLESSSEGLTQISQNLLDGKPIMENVDHAMFSGGMFGFMMSSSPVMAGMVMAKYQTPADYKKFNENTSQLAEINNFLQNTPNISPAVQKNLEKEKQKIEQEIDESITEIEGLVLNEMSPKAFNGYKDLTTKQEELKTEAQDILASNDFKNDPSLKNKIIDDLNKQFNDIQYKRDLFRNHKSFANEFALLENGTETQRLRYQELKTQAEENVRSLKNESPDFMPSNKDVMDEAYNLYVQDNIESRIKSAKRSNGVNFEVARTNQDAKDAVNNAENIDDKQKEEIIAKIDAGTLNGVDDLNGKSYVFMENAISNERTSTIIHEPGHQVFKKILGEGQADFIPMVGQIAAWLEKTDPEMLNVIRLKQSTGATTKVRAEEFVMEFMEQIDQGKIDFDKTNNKKLASLFGYMASNVMSDNGGFNLELKGQADAVNFLVNLAAKIRTGTLTEADIEAAKQSDVIKAIDVDKKADVTIKQSDENLSIKEIFDKFTGPAENRKFKSKKEFQNSPEFFDALLEIEQSNTLDASIRNTVSQPYLDMNPGFVKLVKERISDKYQSEYDASKNSLFGWLTGKNKAGQTIIQLAAGDIQTKTSKQPRTVTTTKKVGGEDSKVTVAETLISDEISPEDYADMKIAQDKLKKIKPQQSKLAKKLDLTENEINLAKRDIISFLRKADRPAMTDPKKFFKAFVDYTTGKKDQPGGFAKVIYDKLSLPKDGRLSTKNREAFIREIAEDLIALNKVDPTVMRRSKWKPFYELEIKNMNPTQMQKAIDEGRIPSTSNLKSGLDLFKTLDPSVDQVVDYLMGIRPDVLKRKMPKFLGEVIVKNEFNEVLQNPKQPVYDRKGKKTDNTIDLSESITEEEVVRGGPQVKEKIARPKGIKFSEEVEGIIQVSGDFEGDVRNINGLLKQALGESIYKHDTKENIDEFFNEVENVWAPVLPKSLITKTVLRPSNRILKNKGKIEIDVDGKKMTTDEYFTNKRNEFLNKKIKYGKEFTGEGSKFKYGKNYGKYFGLTPSAINKANESGKIKQINKMHASMHKQLWQRINKSIRQDPKNAKMWGNYLSLVAQDTEHPHRMGAEMIGWSMNPKGYKGRLYEWEHAMPATRAYLYLMQASLMPELDFDVAYELVMNNFKLIALDRYDDNVKLKGSGRNTSMGQDWNLITDSWLKRYFDDPVAAIENGIDPGSIMGLNNKTFDQEFNIDRSGNTLSKTLTKSISNAKQKVDIPLVNESRVVKASEDMSMEDVLNKAASLDEALRNARNPKAPVKKIRVFDFDDTLARTKSNVLYTMPDGTTGKLTAEEFAQRGDEMLAEGAVWDFSEFNKVMDGKKGPLFEVAKKIQDARGSEDIFVLTARAPEASPAIKEFLDAIGLNIPLKNISGLGDSSPFAKSNWIVDKAAEGYNDFYFTDDHMANVKAVRDALEVLDVKSKVQQAKIKFSEDMNMEFNTILEESKGVDRFKIFSDVKAQVRGARKGRFKFFIPPSAEDFQGLLYSTLGKGKQGERHLQFYDKALFKPYAQAMENLSADRINLMADFKALKKDLDVPKDLKKITESGFTNEQAVRVYLWAKTGQEIPGISKTDFKELSDIVENDPKLKVFADQILSITKGDGYSKPGKNWIGGTITTDLIEILNTTKRTKYLQTWQENVDIIFSKDNINKLEAIFGPKYVEALRSSLTRMKAGRNRVEGGNKLSNRVLDYINNSTGAIMFFNMRSALLQTISAANFINWSFNNPYKAGKAFANQSQYWKDFAKLMNSEYLVDRRNGLKLNINESEIADAAKTSKNKAKAIVSYIIEKGYIPTKFADSFAIATGGATFYRNKIKDLIKNEGLTEVEAEKIAMQEFRRVSEISQQSSDPSKISQQQSTDLGRVVLQFVNTPMQYARIQKRAAQDIINGRGDDKTNVSKIVYYAFLQNMIFNALQSGLFAIGFGDDDDLSESDEKKIFRTANGMMDSWLRGLGMAGVTVQVLKNLGIDIYDRSQKTRPEYTDAWQTLLQFSPAIKSKLSKFKSAAYPFDSKKRRAEVFEKGFSLDNPAYESAAKVITATTNIPLDRLFTKVNNIKGALDEDTEAWQSTAMVLGWPEWQLKDDSKTSKSKSKSTKKSSNKKRVKRKIRRKK